MKQNPLSEIFDLFESFTRRVDEDSNDPFKKFVTINNKELNKNTELSSLVKLIKLKANKSKFQCLQFISFLTRRTISNPSDFKSSYQKFKIAATEIHHEDFFTNPNQVFNQEEITELRKAYLNGTSSEWDELRLNNLKALEKRKRIEEQKRLEYELKLKRTQEEQRERKRHLKLKREKQLKEQKKRDIKLKQDKLDQIKQDLAKLKKIEQNITLAQKDLEELKLQKKHIFNLFEVDFFIAEESYKSTLPNKSIEIFYQWQHEFISNWFTTNTFNPAPSREQSRCIGALGKNFLVTARAGSGKTATSASRALFLMAHCKVPPNQILMLAFNRAAAQELEKRIHQYLLQIKFYNEIKTYLHGQSDKKHASIIKGILDAKLEGSELQLPFVKTFHSLAYSIVQPEQSPIFDGEHPSEKKQSAIIKESLDEMLLDTSFKNKVRIFLIDFMSQNWEENLKHLFDKEKSELLAFQRSLSNVSLKGDYVKSFGEKRIANFLFEHDIKYQYEPNHSWDGVNYKPDFVIAKDANIGFDRIVIEYFGMRGDPNYDNQTEEKREYWFNKPNWSLFEVFPNNIQSKGFDQWFKSHLEKRGVKLKKLSDDEIWGRIKDRLLSSFDNIITSFINRVRKFGYTAKELHNIVKENWDEITRTERNFMYLALPVYERYLKILNNRNQLDFDGILIQAEEMISNDSTIFKGAKYTGDVKQLQYLFLDEFQDFSQLYYNLIKSIQTKSNSELFCVGDDWQSINGFSGSDLNYFLNYEQLISNSNTLSLTTNYRSDRCIVSLGNSVMSGFGQKATAYSIKEGLSQIVYVDNFPVNEFEELRFKTDIITPIILRIISKELEKENSIVLLSRRKSSIGYFIKYANDPEVESKKGLHKVLAHFRSFFPEEFQQKITISTSHSYKGLEEESVIVLDANYRSYPLIHPNWIFTKILGDTLPSIIDEERRLLYVALTRAVKNIYILSNSKNHLSEFLSKCDFSFKHLNPLDYPAYYSENSQTNHHIIKIKGKGTIKAKDHFKSFNFRWDPKSLTWSKSFKKPTPEVKEFIATNLYGHCEEVEIKIFNEEGEVFSEFV